MRVLTTALIAMSVAAGLPAAAQEAGPESLVARTIDLAEAPDIDGAILEPVWQQADALTGFVQIEPVLGATPTMETRAWVLHDDRNLYIAVEALDPQPDAMRVRRLERDLAIDAEPSIRVLLDPLSTGRDGYAFGLNAGGARYDALIENNRTERPEWDTIWQGRAQLTPDGWTAEFAIPFRSLGYRAEAGDWGFQITRMIPRLGEEIRLSNVDRSREIMDLTDVARLSLTAPPRDGLGVEAMVYGIVRVEHGTGEDTDTKGVLEPSVDARWSITPSLNGTVTLNTDFSDAPLDERLVNTGRFALFLPETRDFFLQDASVFQFGGAAFTGDVNGRPFFSRRIGLESGAADGIAAGTKLSGRVGRFGIGALSAWTEEGTAEPQLLSVARLSADVTAGTRIGAIATNGDPSGLTDNTVAGVDLQHIWTGLGGGNLSVDAAVLRSWQGGEAFDTIGSEVAYRSSAWTGFLQYKDIEAGYDPKLGFANRSGIRRMNGYGWKSFYLRDLPISYASLGVARGVVGDRDGTVLDGHFATFLTLRTPRQDQLFLNRLERKTTVLEPFSILSELPVAPGVYDTENYEAHLDLAPSRTVGGRLYVDWGGAYDGETIKVNPILRVRPNRHLAFEAGYTRESFDLPTGDLTVQVVSAGAEFNATPNLRIAGQAQYDDASDRLGLLGKLRWEVTPETELLVALSHGRDLAGPVKTATSQETDTRLTVRFGRVLRF
ncbi:carbohydrate binding family 9 domain-containing protein [Parvularcula dongshanensis]|uniref:Carbohydrate-binding domain-containing protein n=1 Tax=Parvularcula dongshanensis TaxID=1173995 RepID=A0A840I5P4_9PROT|nr:carbohydrate binding family 9 domain-containing protein [Parvularcula dongshanensis]MBB4659593.1 hypothetical protein [Parvularcula dongshanensis]